MYTNIEQRACDLAVYIIENQSTVRSAAARFGVSKSTVHKDLTERLPRINAALYKQVRHLLDVNKAERHIRGGLATREKYRKKYEMIAIRFSDGYQHYSSLRSARRSL